ncbi:MULTISPECIES: hypothetical protein [unclassified Ensifer]|uniref:hypothetical protein n=1 Tax=unclassified Ensifer TaxID=2633371 RepID=UPI0008132F27|nr:MULTISPECIES: hypothetical protein [unclassified Ensifer]OCP22428.1 hypothetical protein BC361_24545 [Ensifer sp. LC54]OCP22639.1 hypothetical protein BC363_26680 [Ensifer sp. LC384]
MARAVNRSIEAQHRNTLPEIDWADLVRPGCYVDEASGDLYRIPKEAFADGNSSLLVRESRGASRLRFLSDDPFMSSMKARIMCAQHNIPVNF